MYMALMYEQILVFPDPFVNCSYWRYCDIV